MHRIKIDVVKPVLIKASTEFVKRYKCASIVIPPELFTAAAISRGVLKATHKIITTVDWPKGQRFMHDKFRGMPSEALQADGFEILLTSRPRNDAIKEIKYLSSFMRDNFPPTIEVRFVFGFFMPDRTEEHFKDFCEGLKFIPHPAMIRTTPLSKIPAVSGTVDAQTRIIDFICSQRNIPIKISGNLNRDMLAKCQAARFGCTLEQAQQIQMEMSKKQTPVTPKSE